MLSNIITFEVREDSLEPAKDYIKIFIEKIHANEPGTLLYKSFQAVESPCKFTHVMTFVDQEAQQLHRTSAYCSEFVKKLYPLCVKPPIPSPCEEIR